MGTETTVKLTSLEPRPYSIIHHEEIDDTRLLQSVLAHGQLRPIICDEGYRIIDGNRLLRALAAAGRQHVWVLHVLCSGDNERALIYMRMNLTHADIDVLKFADLINQLQARNVPVIQLAKATGHTLDEVKDILKLLTFNWANFEKVVDDNPGQLSLL